MISSQQRRLSIARAMLRSSLKVMIVAEIRISTKFSRRTGAGENDTTKITSARIASWARPRPSGVRSYSRGCFIPKKKISAAQKIQLHESVK